MTSPDPFTVPEYGRAALITIDVQNDTLDDGTFEVPGTSTILPRIHQLCRAFRAAGRPIVHAIRIYTPDARDAERCRIGSLLAGKRLLLKGSPGRRPADALLPTQNIHIEEELNHDGVFPVPEDLAIPLRIGGPFGVEKQDPGMRPDIQPGFQRYEIRQVGEQVQ